ncbi:glycoside hydrolase [Syncephalis fuscata]|nr:glycoside hydrolase [Syncephalis fuscata]
MIGAARVTNLGPCQGEDIWRCRKEVVIKSIKDCWQSYREHAFGFDEYKPISKTGKQWSSTGKSLGYMIADSLDTLFLANLQKEYQEGRDWIVKNLDYNIDDNVNVFETTIRVIGGLLGAYTLQPDPELLKAARMVGDRLLPAFNTTTGLPTFWINLVKGRNRDDPTTWASSPAASGTLQMEFRELSRLTGDPKYWQAAKTADEALERMESWDGLLPLSFSSTEKSDGDGTYGFGASGDSYYEYLLKRWLQTSKTEPKLRARYDASIVGARRHLLGVSKTTNQTYLGMASRTYFTPEMEHLACTFGGVLALGATTDAGNKARADNDMALGAELTTTCMGMHRTVSGLSPEAVTFATSSAHDTTTRQSVTNKQNPAGWLGGPDMQPIPEKVYNILRPETVESLFVLWRITKNGEYRKQAWQVFTAMRKNSSVGGNTCLVSVEDVLKMPTQKQDASETFFMAETLKYLLLIFGDNSVLPLDRYVFNTEAHPLPIYNP